jgi:hypothetical protein
MATAMNNAPITEINVITFKFLRLEKTSLNREVKRKKSSYFFVDFFLGVLVVLTFLPLTVKSFSLSSLR